MRSLFSVALLSLTLLTALCYPVEPIFSHDNTFDFVKEYRKLFDILKQQGVTKALKRDDRWPEGSHLASYLTLEILFYPTYQTTLQEIKAFMKRWPDHPYSEQVHRLGEFKIIKNSNRVEALAWYDLRKPRSRAGKIHYLQLLLQMKRQKEAVVLWKELYRTSAVFPKDVRRAMRPFQKQLTEKDHEQRARALLGAGKKRSFQQILRQLPEQHRRYLETLAAAKSTRKAFIRLVETLPETLAQAPELWRERIEGLRRDGFREKANRLLLGEEGRYLTSEDRRLLRYRLGRNFLFQTSSPKAASTLLEANVDEMGGRLEDSLWLAGWSAYQADDWERALQRWMQLAREASSHERRAQGAYWAGKLLLERKSDRAESGFWFAQAARFPEVFYGYLALEKVERGNNSSLSLNDQQKQDCSAVLEDPDFAGERTRLQQLLDVERSWYNNREIQHMAQQRSLTDHEQICLAATYHAPHRSVLLAKRLLKQHDERHWEGLYPKLSWKPDKGWDLDPALIWSVVRQESHFSPHAESGAGAYGLMQLLPGTARGEARQIRRHKRIAYPTRYRLGFTGYNLRLGQSYLRRMLKRFEDDLVLGLVAYNAGMSRAIRWQTLRDTLDPVTFIETIPFTETRHYVKKVLHGAVIYRMRLKHSDSAALSGLLSRKERSLNYTGIMEEEKIL